MEFFSLKLDKMQEKRLKSLADTFLRDIRDYFETKGALLRKLEEGGIGLSVEQAKEVMRRLVKDKTDKHGQENSFKWV